MDRQALRTILQIMTAVLIIFILGVIVFTFVQWIRDEPNSYEPINAFALAVLSAVLVASGWFANKLRDEEPRPLPPPEPAPPGTPPNNTPLYRQMDQLLGLDDIHDLCFDLSLDYENLAGDTKKAKIRSLILEMQRNGRIQDLLTELTTMRPHYTWEAPTAVLPQDVRVRQQFLRRARTQLDEYFHQSLTTAIAIELNLKNHYDATTRKTIYIPGQKAQPMEKPIYDVFEDSARSLLILGAPGSGKTFTLQQLAGELTTQAQSILDEKIPIVLNLSSWAQKQKPLNEWLIEEIFSEYGLSRELGKRWIAHNQLLYLLDGLDEVAEDARNACVEAINNFRAEAQHAIEMVVCSRITDYEALSNRLSMGTAVTIQPLDDDQIAAYLNRDELELKAVRASLQRDPDLQELTKSPLMLNIMTLAYRGMSEDELRTSFGSVEKRREHLFDTYVKEMFKRPLSTDKYNQNQAQYWLANLAYGMQAHNQSVFYIERLQPTWLPSKKLQRQYLRTKGFNSGLLTGLIIGFFVFFLLGGIPNLHLEIIVRFDIWAGLGLIGGIIGLALSRFKNINTIELVEELKWTIPTWGAFTDFLKGDGITGLVTGLILGLIGSLLGGLIGYQINELGDIGDIIFLGAPAGLIFGLVLGLVTRSINILELIVTKRQISDRTYPNQGISKSLYWASRMASIFGTIFGLFIGSIIGLIIGLIFYPVGILLGTIYFSLAFGAAPEATLEFFLRSINDIFSWPILLVGVMLGTGFGAPIGMLSGTIKGAQDFGGNTTISHVILRRILAKNNIVPLPQLKHYVSYLDDMCDHILLRRVGGGWVFIHRTLLEHFAAKHKQDEA